MENKNLKTVALIGRPNVGKSTLFNRLVGHRVAIETPIPGTTRDRLFGEVTWRGVVFNLLDVAGIESDSKKEIDRSIQEGIELAIDNADLILFVVDWNEKNSDIDKEIARRLRKIQKDTLLVVNKADNIERISNMEEFKRLGSFEIIPVSAISGKSSGDLLDEVVKRLEQKPTIQTDHTKYDINLAIIGRPNVGKSTFLNTVIGEKRAVVSAEAGTTRDIVDIDFFHGGKKIHISDTAGLRRPGKVGRDTIESFSTLRTYEALKNSDVAILIIDAVEGLVALDTNILGKAKEWGKGIILAVNKIDLIEGDKGEYMAKMLWQLQGKLNFAPWLPIVFISAGNDENIKPLLNQVVKVDENRHTLFEQAQLDEVLAFAKTKNFQVENVKTFTQKKACPLIFQITFPKKGKPHYTQVRYLENILRDFYPLEGTPIFIDI